MNYPATSYGCPQNIIFECPPQTSPFNVGRGLISNIIGTSSPLYRKYSKIGNFEFCKGLNTKNKKGRHTPPFLNYSKNYN